MIFVEMTAGWLGLEKMEKAKEVLLDLSKITMADSVFVGLEKCSEMVIWVIPMTRFEGCYGLGNSVT